MKEYIKLSKKIAIFTILFACLFVITGCGKTEQNLGNKWYVEDYAPTSAYEANEGDMFLNSKTNDVYQLTSSGWELVTNIAGTSAKSPSIEISEDGYWVINGETANVKAEGVDGKDISVEIDKDGYWIINGKKTKVNANGTDGKTPTIEIKDGNWYIDGTDSGVKAEAKDGETPTIEIKNSNWYINGEDTGVKAEAKDGTKVELKEGFWFLDGVNSGVKVSDFVCKRATTLHTETCNYSKGCQTNNAIGSKIEYGNKSTTAGKLVSGDAFDCDVNGDGNFDSEKERFYYISDYYDTETKTYNEGVAVLVYYSNVIDGNPTYIESVGYGKKDITTNSGPINAGMHMPTATAWGNVYLVKTNRQIVNEEGNAISANLAVNKYDYKGYAARLLTYQEIEKGCGTANVSSTCEYLLEGTIYSQVINRKNGYVIENVYKANNSIVYGIYGGNDASTVFNGIAKNSTYYGVRPVIEVSKARISY